MTTRSGGSTQRSRVTSAVIRVVLGRRYRGMMLLFQRLTGQPRLTLALCFVFALWAIACCVTAGVVIPLGSWGRLIVMLESGALSLGNDFFRSDFISWYVPKTEGVVFHWWWMPRVQWWPVGFWKNGSGYLDVPLYPVVVGLGLVIAFRGRALRVR